METVGDKYMAVSGLPEACKDHARNIARLALQMMAISKHIIDPTGEKVLVCKVILIMYEQLRLQRNRSNILDLFK